MNIYLHIERLVLEPGLSLNAGQLEAAIGKALGEALGASGSVVMPGPGWAIDRLRGTWSGGSPLSAALGQQLAGVLHQGVFSGGHDGYP